MNDKIPKVIHYCWLSDEPIPEEFQKYIQTWKSKLLDYELKLWNFKIFPKEKSIWVKEAFDSKKYAFAADYIRLYAVYSYGGIYMDMDVEVLKDFTDLLNREVIIGYENQKTKLLEAGCFGAEKNNPFIKKCLDYYEDRHFIKPDGTYDMKPLPQIITPIYKEFYSTTPFSSDYFTAKSQATGQIFITDRTYAIHHFAGSWTIPFRKKYMKLRNLLSKKIGITFARFLLSPMHFICVIKEVGFKSAVRKLFGLKKSF